MTSERPKERFRPVRFVTRKTCEIPPHAFWKNGATLGGWLQTAGSASLYLVIPAKAEASLGDWKGQIQ
jgi:hypothetical protein